MSNPPFTPLFPPASWVVVISSCCEMMIFFLFCYIHLENLLFVLSAVETPYQKVFPVLKLLPAMDIGPVSNYLSSMCISHQRNIFLWSFEALVTSR
jgi:hypothetical protein